MAPRPRPSFTVAALVALLGLPALGCVHHHYHGTRVVRVRSHAQHDVRLVFDSRLDCYVVTGHTHHYFRDGLYFRYYDGRWEASVHLSGPWGRAQVQALPRGLREHRFELVEERREEARKHREEHRERAQDRREERRENAAEHRDHAKERREDRREAAAEHRERAQDRREDRREAAAEHRERAQDRRHERREAVAEHRSEPRKQAKERRDDGKKGKSATAKRGGKKDKDGEEKHGEHHPAAHEKD